MRDSHHKEAAEIAMANREPKAIPFSSADAWSCCVPFLCNTLLRLRLVSLMKSVS